MSFSPHSFSDVNSKLYPEDLHFLFSFHLSIFYKVYAIILLLMLSLEMCVCVFLCVCVCVYSSVCIHMGPCHMCLVYRGRVIT